MTPITVSLLILHTIVFIKICTCRYVVPERPPVELMNPENYHADVEFRNHALRVGNIIADLLRSQIRLMLKINSTIAMGKNHYNYSSKSHANHQEFEEHIRSEETHILEAPHVKVRQVTDHHPVENQPFPPVKDPKAKRAHEIKITKKFEKDGASGKTKDCVCPVVSASNVQPNTLMLEQKIYGALDPSSPLIVQRFIWNPHNVSHTSLTSSQHAHGQSSPQVLNYPAVLKPSTSTAIPVPPMGKHLSVNLNNQEHNVNLDSPKTVSKAKINSPPASEPVKQTSYNPLAGLAETTENYIESINPLDRQEQQGKQQKAPPLTVGSLRDNPSEAESHREQPGIELVDTNITEKHPEVVNGEVIEIDNTGEDQTMY